MCNHESGVEPAVLHEEGWQLGVGCKESRLQNVISEEDDKFIHGLFGEV